MAFPIKVCVTCEEEFELKPDKPGFANRCPDCSAPNPDDSTGKVKMDADERKSHAEANEARRARFVTSCTPANKSATAADEVDQFEPVTWRERSCSPCGARNDLAVMFHSDAVGLQGKVGDESFERDRRGDTSEFAALAIENEAERHSLLA